jgi:hypothetical protein
MRPETAKQQQSGQIWIEKDPDPKENRVYASLFAFARLSTAIVQTFPR